MNQLTIPGTTEPETVEPIRRPTAPRTSADRDEIAVEVGGETVMIAADRYYTDPAVALACVRALGFRRVDSMPPVVLDPHVGGGSLLRAVRQIAHFPVCLGLDIDPDAPGFADCDRYEVGDWRTFAMPKGIDAIVANPPFHGFDDHVSLIIDAVVAGRALVAGVLLPESALSAPRLWEVMQGPGREPAEICHIVGRIAFHGPGMDASRERKRIRLRAKLGREPTASELRSGPSTGHVWVIWRHGHTGPCTTSWLRIPKDEA